MRTSPGTASRPPCGSNMTSAPQTRNASSTVGRMSSFLHSRPTRDGSWARKTRSSLKPRSPTAEHAGLRGCSSLPWQQSRTVVAWSRVWSLKSCAKSLGWRTTPTAEHAPPYSPPASWRSMVTLAGAGGRACGRFGALSSEALLQYRGARHALPHVRPPSATARLDRILTRSLAGG
jgi:hypothetical protein